VSHRAVRHGQGIDLKLLWHNGLRVRLAACSCVRHGSLLPRNRFGEALQVTRRKSLFSNENVQGFHWIWAGTCQTPPKWPTHLFRQPDGLSLRSPAPSCTRERRNPSPMLGSALGAVNSPR
jgi:hypothetical protein